jgi:O-antigen/teichoic acid export membrane protein
VLGILKLIWDGVVLRDAARKGQLNWKVWTVGFGFAIAVYAIGLSAALLYVAHPEYKPLFIAAMVVIALLFASVLWWDIRIYLQKKRAPIPDEPAER